MKFWALLYAPFFTVYAIVVTLLSLPLFIPYGLLTLFGFRIAGLSYMKVLARLFGSLYMLGGLVLFSVKGKENIPKNARNICVMSNHQSFADIACITVGLPIKAGFIAKKELYKVPVLNVWLRGINCVAINRHKPRESVAAILKGINNIKCDFPMVIFPEATRSRGNGIRRFRPGSFKLAFKSNSIILPVTIDGAYNIIERFNLVLPFQRVIMTVHPPIDTNLLSNEQTTVLSEELWKTINSGLRTPNLEKLADKEF